MSNQSERLRETIAKAKELDTEEEIQFFGWALDEMVDIDPSKLSETAKDAILRMAAAVQKHVDADQE